MTTLRFVCACWQAWSLLVGIPVAIAVTAFGVVLPRWMVVDHTERDREAYRQLMGDSSPDLP